MVQRGIFQTNPPPKLSDRKLKKSTTAHTLIEQYPVDPDQKIITFDKERAARYWQTIVEVLNCNIQFFSLYLTLTKNYVPILDARLSDDSPLDVHTSNIDWPQGILV